MKIKLLDILKEEILEQGGKFRSSVDLSGKLSPNVAKIGNDGTVVSTYTKKMPQSIGDPTLGNYDPVRAKELVAIAKRYIGTPYKYGGCNPSTGLDCSCFIKQVYDDFGYPLSDRTANSQKTNSEVVTDGELIEGDLVFFNTDENTSDTDHVGLIVSEPGSSEINMIHASSSDGVVEVNNIKGNSYWSSRLISFGRYPIYGSSNFSYENESNLKSDGLISGDFTAAGQKNPYDAAHSFQSRRSDGFGGKLNEKVKTAIQNFKRENNLSVVDIKSVDININPETLKISWSVKIGPSTDGYTYEVIDSRGKAGGTESKVDGQLSSMHSLHSGLEPKLITYFKQKVPIWYNNEGVKQSTKSGEILIHQKFFKYGKKVEVS
jgi:hypothetical protein